MEVEDLSSQHTRSKNRLIPVPQWWFDATAESDVKDAARTCPKEEDDFIAFLDGKEEITVAQSLINEYIMQEDSKTGSSSDLNMSNQNSEVTNLSRFSNYMEELEKIDKSCKKLGLTFEKIRKLEDDLDDVSKKIRNESFSRFETERLKNKCREIERKLVQKKPKKKFVFEIELKNAVSSIVSTDLKREDVKNDLKQSNSECYESTEKKIDFQNGKQCPIVSDSNEIQNIVNDNEVSNQNQLVLKICSISEKKQKHVCENHDVYLNDLDSCDITLAGEIGAMHVRRLNNCVIRVLKVGSSCLLHDCTNSMFVFYELRQLRIHTSKNVVFCTNIRSGPIIEDCTRMNFGPVKKINSDETTVTVNRWAEVQDFKWLKTRSRSPNWDLLPAVLFPKIDTTMENFGEIDHSPILEWMQSGKLPIETVNKDAIVSDEDEI